MSRANGMRPRRMPSFPPLSSRTRISAASSDSGTSWTFGAAAAIKESGKPIILVTSGGGEQMACDNVGKGVFDKEIANQVMDHGRDLNDMISTVLETGLPAGKLKAVIYSPQLVISKDRLRRGLCWSASALKK